MHGASIDCPADALSGFGNAEAGTVTAWTTSPNNGSVHCSRYFGGTSLAAPHVTGTVGLMLSVNRHLRPEQVTSAIRTTATPIPDCGTNCGPGLLDAHSAVRLALSMTTGPCSMRAPGTTCIIDAAARHYSANYRTVIDTIIAYGHLCEYSTQGTQLSVARNLKVIPQYRDGPCADVPENGACVIDSLTVFDYPGIGYVESVTAYGKFWNFRANGTQWPADSTNLPLRSVPRYAGGPCAYASNPTNCKFDTRDLVLWQGWGDGVIESITAYGRYWIFDGTGKLMETDEQRNIARYSNGPCRYAPSNAQCRFDSRELSREDPHTTLETVTAYGRLFEWRNGVPTSRNGQRLIDVNQMR
jgi:hypothetical protein